VKARAAMWYASEFWLTDDDQFDELGRPELKSLVRDILAVAGVPGVDGLEPPRWPLVRAPRQALRQAGGASV
jgi:hypothetical protein